MTPHYCSVRLKAAPWTKADMALKVLIGLLVVMATGLIVYRLAAPRLLTPSPLPPAAVPAGTPVTAATVPTESSSEPPKAIEPPRTTQQQQRYELEIQRAPFYRQLQDLLGPLLADARPNTDDGAVLELYAAQDNSGQTTDTLLSAAAQADAYHYGFRHIRFFLPNSAGNLDRYRLDAEASPDSQGGWQAFRK